MDSILRNKFIEYRKQALEKRLLGNRYLTDKEAILLLTRLLPETNSLLLPEVLKQDLRSRALYDALANWCDPDNGLAAQFPNQILNIAENLLSLENSSVSAAN